MKKLLLFSLLLCSTALAGEYSVKSPDGQVEAKITTGASVSYSVFFNGNRMTQPSEINLCLEDGTVYGGNAKVTKVGKRSVNSTIDAQFYKKNTIEDRFNELSLSFKNFKLVFRAYDKGIAYRFESKARNRFNVVSEKADLSLPEDCTLWACYCRGKDKTIQQQLSTSQENIYSHFPISEWDKKKIAFTPLVAEYGNGQRLLFSEANLMNYPGLYFHNPDGGKTLKSIFPPCPAETESASTGVTMNIIKRVKSVKGHIAECGPGEIFPWRILAVAKDDAEFADSDLVYSLSDPSEGDFSWVKPGKVAWEWWCACNISGVDFKSGINTPTYKHFIDFAAENGIEYIVMDGGWSDRKACDLMVIAKDINLEEIVSYANSKKVGIILWSGYWPFHRDMEKVCRHYSEMGIKGFKVDFHDRDDQDMIRYYRDAAAMTAKYHLLLDLHGCSKPTGLQRTYPNVLNFEGVFGLEMVKFESSINYDFVTNEVTIPFLRMFAGPADYTQGAMINATKDNFFYLLEEPMSQGTRTRQIAEYVSFFAPLSMLCDSPSNYRKEQECTDFIAGIPVTWDETRVISGKIGEYLAIARRKGSDWYFSAINGWNGMDCNETLDFIPAGKYSMTVLCDGVNADRCARDYRKFTAKLPEDRKINFHLAPGGGFIAKITMDK